MTTNDQGRSALLYQLALDRLIPEAERVANRTMGRRPTTTDAYRDWCREWDITFHRAMDRLAEAAGLRKMVGRDDAGRGVQ